MLVCCVKLSLEGHLTFLPPRVMGQQATSTDLTRFYQQTINTWQLPTLEGSPCKHYSYVGGERNTLPFRNM